MKEVPLKLRPAYHKVVKIKDFSGLIIGLVCEFVETSTIQGLIFISTAQSVAAKARHFIHSLAAKVKKAYYIT